MLRSDCLSLNFGTATYFCVALGKFLNLPESPHFHPYKENMDIYYTRVLGEYIMTIIINLSCP